MTVHPVTPMDEADLGRHLAKQTARPIGLMDHVALRSDPLAHLRSDPLAHLLSEPGAIVSLDSLDTETLAAAGKLIWEARGPTQFVIGP